MKKQKGFTLIELMVVMAIIAILATAGLSAYTGYIKKSRDTKRISDLAAINTIIQGSLSANGSPPASMDSVVSEANNGQMITDPLPTTSVCYTDAAGTTTGACEYTYTPCDDGAGYLITAHFESKGNAADYTTTGGAPEGYHVGSCTLASGAGGPATITVGTNTWMATDLGGPGTFYQGNKTTAGWTPGWDGTGPGSGDPCAAAYPGFRMPIEPEFLALSPEDITTLDLSMNGGYLDADDGSTQGTDGHYWGYFYGPIYGTAMHFESGNKYMSDDVVGRGFSVRCLQD